MIYVRGNKKLKAKYKGTRRIIKIYHGTHVVWSGNTFNKWSYNLNWNYNSSWKYN